LQFQRQLLYITFTASKEQNMFSDLITSKSRVKLLNVFLSNPSEMFHVRELVRRTQDEINAVRRELSFLEKKGILTREPRANRVYYSLSKHYPFYYDLLRLGSKNIGLGAEILKNKVKLGKIKFTTLSSGFIRRRPVGPNDVDLLIVGNVVLPQLAALVKQSEDTLGREINYTVMSEDEFTFRKRRKDPFVTNVLEKMGVVLIGDEEDLRN